MSSFVPRDEIRSSVVFNDILALPLQSPSKSFLPFRSSVSLPRAVHAPVSGEKSQEVAEEGGRAKGGRGEGCG